MFKHKSARPLKDKELKDKPEVADEDEVVSRVADKEEESEPGLQALLEKNLKWSQIIYEQNRKINHKMTWLAVAGWLRVLVIATPIVLALWYLPPFVSRIQTAIQEYTGNAIPGKPAYSLEQLMQLLPLGDVEKEQLKAILK